MLFVVCLSNLLYSLVSGEFRLARLPYARFESFQFLLWNGFNIIIEIDVKGVISNN
jgi:hypothetical protein